MGSNGSTGMASKQHTVDDLARWTREQVCIQEEEMGTRCAGGCGDQVTDRKRWGHTEDTQW